VQRLLECVPNFSEGRDPAVIDALVAAVRRHARVLDVHRDADHNRCVLTCVGEPGDLVDGIAGAIATAAERIDLRRHDGVHPRVGAADVVPFVRFHPADRRPVEAAEELGRRVAGMGIPAFGYAELGEGRRPAFYRAGGPERLAERLAAGEIAPRHGPARLHPAAGAVLLGVRKPLIAFNVNLDTDRLEVAQAVAAAIRWSSGGLPGVQALGLLLERERLAQVSTNLIDIDATPLWRVVEEIERHAAARGAGIRESELVGLMPARVAAAAAARALRLPDEQPDRLLEVAVGGEFGREGPPVH
jgi:glutamate formiminotransferase